ncbi:MAG: hypothetical protein JO199_07820 [Candidatus Eremiobacteraeota bacterium]|nr:hypothetical protein [Candidatus Eremiobacteraeota bacterium]
MRKRRIVIAIAVCLFAAVVLGGALLSGSASRIDDAHWTGAPIPPCFVDRSACAGHVLGTDNEGRDELARLVAGTRTSLLVSLAALAVEFAVMWILAAACRSASGAVRDGVLRVAAALASFPVWPFLFLALQDVVGLNRGAPAKLGTIVVLAGVLFAVRRLVPTLEEASSLSWQRAVSDWGAMILVLATIDFFGLGVFPPAASLGNMLFAFWRFLNAAWWAAVFPAIALFVLALALSLASRVSSEDSGYGKQTKNYQP